MGVVDDIMDLIDGKTEAQKCQDTIEQLRKQLEEQDDS